MRRRWHDTPSPAWNPTVTRDVGVDNLVEVGIDRRIPITFCVHGISIDICLCIDPIEVYILVGVEQVEVAVSVRDFGSLLTL